MKRQVFMAIISCFLLLTISTVCVLGEAVPQITPRYTHINLISAGISINGDTITYDGSGEAISTSNRATITVKLQRQSISGGSWTSVTSHTAYGGYASQADYTGYYTASMSYKYRTYVKCTIYDSAGNALETSSMYSHVLDPRVAN